MYIIVIIIIIIIIVWVQLKVSRNVWPEYNRSFLYDKLYAEIPCTSRLYHI